MPTNSHRQDAPLDRINLSYTPTTGPHAGRKVELPLRMLVIGDFKGGREDAPLKERTAVDINPQNFTDVMAASDIRLKITVPNMLIDRPDGEKQPELSIDCPIKSLEDFTPDKLLQNIPELKRLLQFRERLTGWKLKHYTTAEQRLDALQNMLALDCRMTASLILDHIKLPTITPTHG